MITSAHWQRVMAELCERRASDKSLTDAQRSRWVEHRDRHLRDAASLAKWTKPATA